MDEGWRNVGGPLLTFLKEKIPFGPFFQVGLPLVAFFIAPITVQDNLVTLQG